MTLEEFRGMVLSIQDRVIISQIKFGVDMYDPKIMRSGIKCEYCGEEWGDHAGTMCGKRRHGTGGRHYPEEWPADVYTMAPHYPHIAKLVERYNDVFGIFIEPQMRSLFGTKDMAKPIKQMRELIAKMQKGS